LPKPAPTPTNPPKEATVSFAITIVLATDNEDDATEFAQSLTVYEGVSNPVVVRVSEPE
jgi:hypothetical protein